MDRLPPSPYDLGPLDPPEAYYRDVWIVRLYERPRAGGQRLELDAWILHDELVAELHAAALLSNPNLNCDDYIYTTVIEEGQEECDPPEDDWDCAPGGHDDY